MDVFDLFAKITLDSSEYEEQLGEAGSKTSGFADKLKSGLATAGKVAGAGLAAATTAIAALGKASIEGYAEYEQLIGGVETLYGSEAMSIEEYAKSVGKSVDEVSHQYEMLMNRQDAVMENAQNAYKTAGMSANEYMNTVNGFAASLTSSLGEYEWQAAGYADMIVTDMADNANKMGTSLESIQNAYSGFAKQNYTMLDNLKLGYGGTKEEMERLLRDAEKYAGYIEGSLSIESFADVAEAINIVQTELGITGTTAKEASGTISGSIATMKGAWENFLTGMADPSQDFGALLGNLVDSVITVGNNIVPRIQELLPRLTEGITQLVSNLLPHIPETLNTLLPTLVDGAASLLNGFTAVLPELITTAVNAIPQLLEAGASIIQNLVGALMESAPVILETGVQLLSEMVSGIESGLPDMVARLPVVIDGILDFITDNLPKVLEIGGELLERFTFGIIEAIPNLVAALPEVIESLTDFFVTNFPKIIKTGGELLGKLIAGILGAIPEIAVKIPKVLTAINDAFKAGRETLRQSGRYLLEGLWNGISDKISWLKSKVTGVIDTIKGWFTGREGFDEHSPSKWSKGVFQYIMEGGGQGLEAGLPSLLSDVRNVTDRVKSGMALGTASIDFASSGIGKNTGAVASAVSAMDSRPIVITVQSVLDGKVIGETSYQYAKNKGRMYGMA